MSSPWISYFGGSFWYHPDSANFAMLKDISYFYTSRPYFLSSKYTWPSIGPDLDNPFLKEGEYDRQISQTIPAVGRYKAGYETYISNFTSLAP